MTFTVLIDELVFSEDFRRIDHKDQQRIIRAIRQKLVIDPEGYGSPLKGPFKGFWKLRVGEFRVVYSIDKGKVEVYVIAAGFRRNEEVYREAAKRLTG